MVNHTEGTPPGHATVAVNTPQSVTRRPTLGLRLITQFNSFLKISIHLVIRLAVCVNNNLLPTNKPMSIDIFRQGGRCETESAEVRVHGKQETGPYVP